MLRRFRRQPAPEAQGPLPYEPMPSFEAAEAAAGLGYNNEAILRATRAAEIDPCPSLAAMPDFFGPFFLMLALAASGKDKVRVADFGGAIGDYHDYANTFFAGRVSFDWAVIETEMYVELGREICPQRAFYTSLDELPWQPDIVMFSGSLQYIKDWKAYLLHTATKSAEMIFISRTPLGSEYQPFLQTVEYGDLSLKYPGAILKEDDLTDLLCTTHDLYASWALESHLKNLGVQKTPAMIWQRGR